MEEGARGMWEFRNMIRYEKELMRSEGGYDAVHIRWGYFDVCFVSVSADLRTKNALLLISPQTRTPNMRSCFKLDWPKNSWQKHLPHEQSWSICLCCFSILTSIRKHFILFITNYRMSKPRCSLVAAEFWLVIVFPMLHKQMAWDLICTSEFNRDMFLTIIFIKHFSHFIVLYIFFILSGIRKSWDFKVVWTWLATILGYNSSVVIRTDWYELLPPKIEPTGRPNRFLSLLLLVWLTSTWRW